MGLEKDADKVTQLVVGGVRVGIAGLEGIAEEVQKLGLSSGDDVGRALLERVCKKNYVPAAAEEEYRQALVRWYRHWVTGEEPPVEQERTGLEIKVLGPGCRKCETLAKEVYKALERLKIPADVKKITDVNEIAGHNILMTPGLIINGKIKSAGKVPKPQQIEKWIQEEVPLSIRF